MKISFLTCCLFWLTFGRSYAFDEGFYPFATSQSKQTKPAQKAPYVAPLAPAFKQIQETAASADRVLYCRSIDEIDIGIGSIDHRSNLRHPIFFKRAEIENFLKQEKNKELLTVWFEKTMRFSDRNKLELKPFLNRLGYKRVLILGFHSSGVFVISDTLSKKSTSR